MEAGIRGAGVGEVGAGEAGVERDGVGEAGGRTSSTSCSEGRVGAVTTWCFVILSLECAAVHSAHR